MIYFSSNSRNPGSGIGCLLFGVIGLIAVYYLLTWFFKFLWWAAPAFLVLAVIINWKSVANTGRALLRTLQRSPIMGILYIALVIIGFPIFAGYLFLQSIFANKIASLQQRFGNNPTAPSAKDEYVDFEELDSKPKQPLRSGDKQPESGKDF